MARRLTHHFTSHQSFATLLASASAVISTIPRKRIRGSSHARAKERRQTSSSLPSSSSWSYTLGAWRNSSDEEHDRRTNVPRKDGISRERQYICLTLPLYLDSNYGMTDRFRV